MVAAREDVYDCHKVFGELLFCGTYLLILDHEMGVVPLTEPFNEFEGKSAESVLVGNHNLLDASLHDLVHQP
jgi:hypothetical protein